MLASRVSHLKQRPQVWGRGVGVRVARAYIQLSAAPFVSPLACLCHLSSGDVAQNVNDTQKHACLRCSLGHLYTLQEKSR